MSTLLTLIVTFYVVTATWNELTKYVMIPQTVTNFEGDGLANDACKSQYGTSLASIHNADDDVQAQQMCQAQVGSVTDSGCIIGLTDYTSEGTWKWIDGTTLDYGTTLGTTPWSSGEPGSSGDNRDCVILGSGDNYLWKDKSCGKTLYYTLCNKQSELCYPNNWTTHPQWIWSNDNWNCDLTNNNDGTNVDNIVLDIASNRWNYIALDYMLRITPASAPTGKAGIVLTVVDAENVAISHTFYVGLKVKDGDSNLYLFWSYITGGGDQDFIVATFDVTSYYELRFEFEDGVFTTMHPNEVPLVVDVNSVLPSNYYVDSIEIQNEYLSTVSKYLFINGVNMETNQPTMYPTQPIQQTTNIPITVQPTKPPTKQPSITTTVAMTSSDSVTSVESLTTTKQEITSEGSISSTDSEMIGTVSPTISPTEGADGAVNDNTDTTIYFEGDKNDNKMNEEDGIGTTMLIIIGCIGCLLLLLVICIMMKCRKRKEKQKKYDMNGIKRSIAQQKFESKNNIHSKLENILVIDGKKINETSQHITAGGNDTTSEDEGSDDIDSGSGNIETGIAMNGETNSDEFVVDNNDIDDDTDEVTPNGGDVVDDEFIMNNNNNNIVTVDGQNDDNIDNKKQFIIDNHNDDEIIIADINDDEFVINDDIITSNGDINIINGDVELQEIDNEQHTHFTNEGHHDIEHVIFVKNTQNNFEQNLVDNALGNDLLMNDIVDAINGNHIVTKR